MPILRNLTIELMVMIGVAFLLAALGPYGSFALGSFTARLAYWLPASFGGYAIVRPIILIATVVGKRMQFPQALSSSVAVLVSAMPLTLLILWLNGNSLGELPPFEGWFQLYVQIVLIGGAITLLFWLLERRISTTSLTTTTETEKHLPVLFMSRLPPHLREGLLALEMEDHYVRVHTTSTSTLILLRMSDAVAELEGADGMQVHRSWWVARAAVEQITVEGRKMTLTLTGGLKAPVARNSVPALRAAGWLRSDQNRYAL